ncbi:right-handed parallel beta-helix repeat-containing protein [Geobacter sp. AOG1]|uniref:right-handed parallel beta-helix repeat-containing protein n=1 Tax=Geobacter sp. AOG1 TaxID=1566346 RepID=UPI001CC5DA42|nr:right-handed parallel beta-helix repeat-containing protein [Geobacter sp. AOG1]GFE58385.1 hypothetical protein AOG1_22650 [Geobacter sp. AOG1]
MKKSIMAHKARIVILITLISACLTSAGWAANYYVDAINGNDTNTGTQTAPWKTVAKVNSTTRAGDTVSFNSGGVWNESLTPVSGTSLNSTIYKSYGTGSKPKIKGMVLNNKSYILVQDLEIWNDNANYPVYIYNGSNHITVKNCYVWASSSCGWWAAFYVTNANYNDFEYNTVEHQNFSGLHDAFNLDQGSSHNIIKYNTLGDAAHYSLSLVGASNTNPTWESSYNYIGYNTITNTRGAPAGICTTTNNNIIEYNKMSSGNNGMVDQYPTAFKLLGSNNVFRYNILKDMPAGTTNGRGMRSETYLYASGWPVNKATYNHVYNNVITNLGGTEAANGAIYIGTNTTDSTAQNAFNVFKNNIVFNNTLPYEITKQNSPLIHDNAFTNNIIFRSGATNVVYSDGSGKSVASQQAYDSLWKGNIQSDPILDTSFMPLAGSPAINGGANLTTITSPSGTGTSFTVADSAYFTDGMGIVSGDTIQIGSQTAIITAINYSTNVLNLDRTVTWTQGTPVNLPYNGTKPNIGLVQASASAPIVLPVPRNLQ